MRCFNHSQVDAVAVCVNCGRALCPQCSTPSETGRLVCSVPCAEAVQKTEVTLSLIQTKTAANHKVSGWSAILAGFVFGLFGIVFPLLDEVPLAAGGFMLLLSLVLVLTGLWYLKAGRDKERASNKRLQPDGPRR